MSNESQRIWDLPIRIFHWSLVIGIAFSWWSAEYGELEWHKRSGYTLLSLIIFRILWGLWGSSTARFSQFLRGPSSVLSYSKTLFVKNPEKASTKNNSIGHNPLGGWSVVAILLLILLQILLGLFAEDVDGLDSGPLSYLVSFDTGRWAAKTHESVFNVLLVIIFIHIFAAFFYLFYKGVNLIKPLFTGKSSSPTSGLSSSLTFAPLWLAIVTLTGASMFVWWLVT